MASIFSLQDRVAGMMLGGTPLDRVESEVIEPSDLSSDQKAALWLYAWSFMDGRHQRSEATRYLVNSRERPTRTPG